MKAPLPMDNDTPPTREQLEAKQSALSAQIAEKQALHDHLRDTIPQIIATQVGSEIAAARERKQLRELAEDIAHLERAKQVIVGLIEQLDEREVQERVKQKRVDCERIAKEMQATVIRAEQLVDELSEIVTKTIPELDKRFCYGLPTLPRGQVMVDFARKLPSYVLRRYQAHIAGSGAVRGTIETGYELLESGRVDLLNHLTLYLRVGMSAFAVEAPQPPETA